MVLTEELLHFIWRFRLFNFSNLRTIDGEVLKIEDTGQPNADAGPDFEFARISIGDTLWSGHVEIHVNEEDWVKHAHQQDKRYDTTILHVVWRSSACSVRRTDGTSIPTLVLKDRVDSSLIERYEALMHNEYWIPCEKQVGLVNEVTVYSWLERMAIERLEGKYKEHFQLLELTKYDWERVFMISLGRAFGMKVNAYSFKELCTRINLNLVHKYSDSAFKVESMIFGQAGLLEMALDDYTLNMQKEYRYLKSIHDLEEMTPESWRFFRMRPYNFPTFRLGQFISLLCHRSYWFAYLLEIDVVDELFEKIDEIVLNEYWETHYRFGIETVPHGTNWSKAFKVHLVINCFVPMLFVYGNFMNEEKYKDKALKWLYDMPAETNKITNGFKKYGISSQHAADSQALLNLKGKYCGMKKCLNCAIGLSILKR